MSVKVRCWNGTWYVVVHHKGKRQSKAYSSEEEAQKKAKVLETYLEAEGKVMLPRPERKSMSELPTLAEFSERRIAELANSDLKSSTLMSYKSNLKHHLLPAMGELPIDEINYARIKELLTVKTAATYGSARFRKRMPEKERHPGPRRKKKPEPILKDYSKDSLRLMIATLRTIMGEAVKEGLIPMNPVSGLSTYYRKRKQRRIIQRADVYQIGELHRLEEKLFERFPEFYEFTLAMSREGLRVGEAAALLVTDVDFERGTILINKNIPSGIGQLEESAKTEASDREIEVSSQEFLTSVKSMLTRRKAEYFRLGKSEPDSLFAGSAGRPIDYAAFYKAWGRVHALIGIRYRKPHYLRHTWASQQIAAGEDPSWVSKHLGHANVGITLTIYTHFVPGQKRLKESVLDRQSIDAKTSVKRQ